MIEILWLVTLDRGQLLLSSLCGEVALALKPEGLGFLECTVIVFLSGMLLRFARVQVSSKQAIC